MERQYTNLFQFPRGLVSRRANILQFPQDALTDGTNFDCSDGYMTTRRGRLYCSQRTVASNPLANATVEFLGQVRFPTNQKTFLVAQCNDKLYVSKDQLPVQDGTADWTEIYDLSASAGVITMAQLGDRVIFTEGVNNAPLVWAGCQETDGSDWMAPKRVLISWDDTYYDDITDDTTDTDSSTVAGAAISTSGYLYVCSDMPTLSAIRIEIGTGNDTAAVMTAQLYDGSWSALSSVSDGTDVSGDSMKQSGSVTFTEDTATHTLVGNIPGYWYRFSWDANLDAGTTISRILLKAPCQELSVLGDGQPETPMVFLFRDDSKDSIKDYTIDVSDYTLPTTARLNDGDLQSPEAMTSSDEILVGFPLPFNAIEITPADHNNNQTAATLSATYWDGDSWAALSITDGTLDDGSTITLSQKGKITFTAPSGWKMSSVYTGQYPIAYYVKLAVSTTITAATWVAEVRIYPEYESLRKKRHVFRYRDRLVFADDTAARDQVDISRQYDEYGWVGPDSYAIRMGGQDVITSTAEGYNQGWLFQTQDLMMLNGYNPATYSLERAEVANQVPLNPRVLVKAPLVGVENGENRMGFYYINYEGAWHFTGLQLYQISDNVNWWDADSNPQIDLDYLHGACGVYWPAKNWVVWAVPMITGAGSSQTTNNYLLIYDLTLRAWLLPYNIPAASLATAFEYQASGVGLLGRMRCYAGNYSGDVVELFPQATTQDWGTTDISASFKTGWLHHGYPELIKRIEAIRVWGSAASGATITLKIYRDGVENTSTSRTITEFVGLASTQTFDLGWIFREKLQASFFKYEITADKQATIYGIQVQWLPHRTHKGSRLS